MKFFDLFLFVVFQFCELTLLLADWLNDGACGRQRSLAFHSTLHSSVTVAATDANTAGRSTQQKCTKLNQNLKGDPTTTQLKSFVSSFTVGLRWIVWNSTWEQKMRTLTRTLPKPAQARAENAKTSRWRYCSYVKRTKNIYFRRSDCSLVLLYYYYHVTIPALLPHLARCWWLWIFISRKHFWELKIKFKKKYLLTNNNVNLKFCSFILHTEKLLNHQVIHTYLKYL